MANYETYSCEQREEVRARLGRFQDKQKAIKDQIRILKGRYSNQIYQMRKSITKFLDKETGTLGERIRALFEEQGIMILSILTAVGMAIGVLIESLLGGPTAPNTATSGNTSGDHRKSSGAREWIGNKLKALSQLLGKLADKALAALPGIIGSILSWILNRAKEVVGWLVISELLGIYNRCSSFDIHVFYDENEKEINHFNSHRTIKIDVIPISKLYFLPREYQVWF